MYELRPLNQVHLSRLSPVMWRFGGTYPRKTLSTPIGKTGVSGVGSDEVSSWPTVKDLAVYGVAGAVLYFLLKKPSPSNNPGNEQKWISQGFAWAGVEPTSDMFREVERRLSLARKRHEEVGGTYISVTARSVGLDSQRKQEVAKRREQVEIKKSLERAEKDRTFSMLLNMLKERAGELIKRGDLTEPQVRAVFSAVTLMSGGIEAKKQGQYSDLEYQDRRRGLILLVVGKKNKVPSLPEDHPLRIWIEQRKRAWGE